MDVSGIEPADRRAFLGDRDLQAVFDALEAGGVTRVVGGAVRNALLGLPVKDVDLATTIMPREVMRLAGFAGLKAVPTGLDHGTVTIVSGKKPFEVTTLRADIETFGRHAIVAHIDDWLEDAKRRDFTINALYCDRDGTLYDPLDGRKDIDRRCVRFVGNPDTRIAEDRLRILRFFRISAEYGAGPLDKAGLKAACAARAGLDELSRARVRAEVFKLLIAARASEIIKIMSEAEILDHLLPGALAFDWFDNVCEIEAALEVKGDAVLRLATLYGGKVAIKDLSYRLELTKKEIQRLDALSACVETPGLPGNDALARPWLYRLKENIFRDMVMVAWAKSGTSPGDQDWRALYSLPDRWRVPKFPLGGEDVLALGVPKGAEIGRVLGVVEEKWIANGFVDEDGFLDAALKQAVANPPR